jgi:hypothetical protein
MGPVARELRHVCRAVSRSALRRARLRSDHRKRVWFGGMLPLTATALVAANGDICAGPSSPVIVAAVGLVVGAIFIRETKGRSIHVL